MTTKTFRLGKADIDRKWQVLDAGGRPVGRVASEVASLLLGKHKPTYEPHLAMGDHVIVLNAGQVVLTGRKAEQKIYYRHSGYPGGLRERSFEQQMARDPRRVIELAVRGMLPKNSRGRELFRHLWVYAGSDHPHEAQVLAGTGARARKRAAADERAAAPSVMEPASEAQPEPTPEAIEEAEETVEPVAAEATAVIEEAAPVVEASQADEAQLEGSLTRHRRPELDAEAARLGIEIDPAWRKDDVVDAIRDYYEAHPLPEDQ
jgi:large subunit ribosomal protein L13